MICITDGEPTDTPKDAVLQVIRDWQGRLGPQYGPKAVAYQFAQVGGWLGKAGMHAHVSGAGRK